MSRPFSYSDENFTVIDNLLFVHFFDINARKAFEPVIPVPYEIYKRMLTYGNEVFVSPSLSSYAGVIAGITIVMKNDKPYIAFGSDRNSTVGKRYHYTFYLLKDI